MKTFILLLLSFTVLSAQADFSVSQVPFIKLSLPTKPLKTKEAAFAAIKMSLLQGQLNIHPSLEKDVRASLKAFIGNTPTIGPVEKPIAHQVTGFTDVDDRWWGKVSPRGSEKGLTHFAVFVSKELEPLPFQYYITAAHEMLGHLPQMLTIHRQMSPQQSAKWFSSSPDLKKFIQMTHISASFMEWQMMKFIDLKFIVEEIQNSNLPEKIKVGMSNSWIKRYALAPKAGIYLRAAHEACPKENPKCIPDATFNEVMSHLEGMGVSF